MKTGASISISPTKSVYLLLLITYCFLDFVSCQWSYIGENNIYAYNQDEDEEASTDPPTDGNLANYTGENCIIEDKF
jgi:hypothetical protein